MSVSALRNTPSRLRYGPGAKLPPGVKVDPNHPLGRRILHWWTGLPAQGASVPDLAGNTPLIFTDGGGESPSWVNGEFSTNDLQNGPYAASADEPFPFYTRGLTFSCWFKPDRDWVPANNDYHGLIFFGNIFIGNHVGLYILEASGTVAYTFRMRDAESNFSQYIHTDADTSKYTNKWTHLLATVGSYDATPLVYINGALTTGGTSDNSATAYPVATDRWLMGRIDEGSNNQDWSFPGQIRNAMVIDGFVTAKDVWDLYNDTYAALIEDHSLENSCFRRSQESGKSFFLKSPSIQLARGAGVATFTRATTATVIDHEGLVKTVLSGEARFAGGRRVHNLCVDSEDFTNTGNEVTGWAHTAGGETINHVSGAETGPIEGVADTLEFITDASAGAHIKTETLSAAEHGSVKTLVLSGWIKGLDGTTDWCLNIYDGAHHRANLTITDEWRRYSISVTTDGGGQVLAYVCDTRNGNMNSGTYKAAVWGFQVEDITGQSNENPGDYVSKGVLSAPFHGAGVDGVRYFKTANGNTVASNVVTEATGAALDPLPALLMEDVDALSYPLAGNVDKTRGTLIFEGWVPLFDETDITAAQLMFNVNDSSASILYLASDGNLASNDGTNAELRSLAYTNGNEYNIAVRWSGSEMEVGYKDVTGAGSWTWSTAGSFDGAYTTVNTLHLFLSNDYSNKVRNIIVYDDDKGTAWIEANY